MRNTIFNTVFALALSTGLVACVTDDGGVDTEELAENPDVLPDEQIGDDPAVDPSGVHENPTDAPGQIPAPSQGGAHVPGTGSVTTDMGVTRPNGTQGEPVVVDQSTQDLAVTHGSATGAHVDGKTIGQSCDGQDAGCRSGVPSLVQRPL